MKAVILAAGYGTRLYPMTIDKPKALLDIGEKKILDLIIERIPKEIKDIKIVTNAKFYHLFDKWLKESSIKDSNIKIGLINDCTNCYENRLGAIRDMHLALSKEKEEDALIIASDNLFDFDLNDPLELFKKIRRDIIIAYDIKDKNNATRFGVLSTDENGKIVKFEEKPKEPETSLISTGIYFFTKDSLKRIQRYIEEGVNIDGLGNFIKWHASTKDVHALVAKGKWYDIGTLESYNDALKSFK